MKILLGDSDAKIGKGDNFKPTFGNENLHEISNDDMPIKKCTHPIAV